MFVGERQTKMVNGELGIVNPSVWGKTELLGQGG